MIKKIKDEIGKDEKKLQKSIGEVEKIWEDTGLDPKDPSYLVEKTMRFEMAQNSINEIFLLVNQIINKYKKLCAELESSKES